MIELHYLVTQPVACCWYKLKRAVDPKLNLGYTTCYWRFIRIWTFYADNKLSIWEIWCVPLDCLISKTFFLIKMLWSIVSSVFCKSIRSIPVRRPESNPFVISSWRYDKQASVEWNFRKPDWYLYKTLLSNRKFIVWSWIIRSIILEISGSSEMGLKFFGSVLRPFLYKGLIFATLHLSERSETSVRDNIPQQLYWL